MSEREIRFARHDEADSIRRFLRTHWANDFSVAQSRSLFDFLYADDDRINVVVALDCDDIVGILGVSPYSRDNADAFLTLWRSIDTKFNTGIDLLKFAMAQGFRSLSSVGTRKEVLVIYKMLGFRTGPMLQHIRVNPTKKQFRILVPGAHVPLPIRQAAPGTRLVEVSDFNADFSGFARLDPPSPYKSRAYLEHRYFAHPVYRYRAFELWRDDAIENYFVTRTVDVDGATALRIVDCLADDAGFVDFAAHLDQLLVAEGHEHVDFYNVNVDSALLSQAGYVERSDIDGMIAPNYFEPFLQENEQKFYVTTLAEPRLYKGDGDMDRPFRLTKEEPR